MSRLEVKFLFDTQKLTVLRGLITARFGADLTSRSYPVLSTYFDSPDLDCYWAKVEGVPVRYKLRQRSYGGHESFLEWKLRSGEITHKTRIRLEAPSTESAILHHWPHQYLERPNYFHLPTLDVSYRRTEFTSSRSWLRVTVDEEISHRTAGTTQSWRPTYGHQHGILEIKVPAGARLDDSIFEVPRLLQLQRASLSKYADSLKQVRRI